MSLGGLTLSDVLLICTLPLERSCAWAEEPSLVTEDERKEEEGRRSIALSAFPFLVYLVE